jgi:hypothetical protein
MKQASVTVRMVARLRRQLVRICRQSGRSRSAVRRSDADVARQVS